MICTVGHFLMHHFECFFPCGFKKHFKKNIPRPEVVIEVTSE